MKLEHIKDLIQSCNLNFLIGSGLSNPYLSTLGNIEKILTEIEKKEETETSTIIKASLYKKYCEDVIFRNLPSIINEYKKKYRDRDRDKEIDKSDKYLQYRSVLKSYKEFLLSINEILLYRHNNLLSKQVNLFTTNIDLFLEKSLEESSLEFNDGFRGRNKPIYDLSNFQKSYSKTSSHYDNVSEIPVFNLLKMHGSINWRQNDSKKIIYANSLKYVLAIKKELDKISADSFIEIKGDENYDELVKSAGKVKLKEKTIFNSFFEEYSYFVMVNPTKEKFERTVIDEEYYELLRIYANSLEKENTVLFVMGFSFSDEHIRNITIRAANSNPTLQVLILLYSDDEFDEIISKLDGSRNNNIQIITPQSFVEKNKENDEKDYPEKQKLNERLKNFDCQSINKEIFGELRTRVRYRIISK